MRRKRKKCTYASHSTWGKIWHFLWHEDTWASFLADAILIILIGKLLLYPGIGLVMGTDFPAVAVISGSMDHNDQTFGDWWGSNENQYASYNITESEFKDFSFRNGFSKGDILIVSSKPDYNVGDVLVYSVSSRPYPIIHRIVIEDLTTYATKGDANSGQLGFERSIGADQIHGRAIFKIPYLGWLKVGFVELFN